MHTQAAQGQLHMHEGTFTQSLVVHLHTGFGAADAYLAAAGVLCHQGMRTWSWRNRHKTGKPAPASAPSGGRNSCRAASSSAISASASLAGWGASCWAAGSITARVFQASKASPAKSQPVWVPAVSLPLTSMLARGAFGSMKAVVASQSMSGYVNERQARNRREHAPGIYSSPDRSWRHAHMPA